MATTKPLISITGVKQATAYLQKEKARIQADSIRGIKEATLFMEREVKMSVAGKRGETKSWDTGTFIRSITHGFGNMYGVVYSPVHYAPYLEYGTSKGLKPRWHFRNSLNRNRGKIRDIIQKALGKGILPSLSVN